MLEADGENLAVGEGYRSRTVRVRVDSILWNPLGAATKTGELTIATLGWIEKSGRFSALVTTEAPRLLPGGQYVIPMVFWKEYVTALTDSSIVPAPGSKVAADDAAAHGIGASARSLAGLDLPQIKVAIENAPTNVVAENLRSLPSRERIRAVLQRVAP